jgi:hypothetical protein
MSMPVQTNVYSRRPWGRHAVVVGIEAQRISSADDCTIVWTEAEAIPVACCRYVPRATAGPSVVLPSVISSRTRPFVSMPIAMSANDAIR